MNYKWIVVILMLVNIAYESFIEFLDRRSLNREIPRCVSDVYDAKEYKTWHAYKRAKDSLSAKSQAVSALINILFMVFDVYALFARLFPMDTYCQLFSIIILHSIVGIVVGVPFGIYRTFVIEAKFGFNKKTPKVFVLDQIKGTIITIILLGGIISLFTALHQWLGNLVIIIFTIAMMVIGFIITLLAPLLTRLFNKFMPLEDGELRYRLTQMLTSHGYKVRAVEVMDASTRSTKMNAYFTGIGPSKTIVLYDTLVEAATTDQLCAVFAHEMGHGLHHDSIKEKIYSVVSSLFVVSVIWVLVSYPHIYRDFGFTDVNYGFAFILTSWALSVIDPLVDYVKNQQSQKAEFYADAQAVKEGYGEHLISVLKLLAKKNLSDLTPDPLLVKLTYSHPTLEQRIVAMEELMLEQSAG